jgi:hypothetical protein
VEESAWNPIIGRPWWFLVETGHLYGTEPTVLTVFRWQPTGEPLFSALVLFGSRELAAAVAATIDQKEARKGLGMILTPGKAATTEHLVGLLEQLQSGGLRRVIFNTGPEHDTAIAVAIAGFRAAAAGG